MRNKRKDAAVLANNFGQKVFDAMWIGFQYGYRSQKSDNSVNADLDRYRMYARVIIGRPFVAGEAIVTTDAVEGKYRRFILLSEDNDARDDLDTVQAVLRGEAGIPSESTEVLCKYINYFREVLDNAFENGVSAGRYDNKTCSEYIRKREQQYFAELVCRQLLGRCLKQIVVAIP